MLIFYGAQKKDAAKKYDLYDVFCAVIYVIQGGIQWRMLPSDYPSGRQCITILEYGLKKVRQGSAYWTKFC